MRLENKQSQNNLKTLTVGFFIILFTVALFFAKSYFFGKKDKTTDFASSHSTTDIQKYKSISGSEMLKKINSNKSLVLLDIRSADSFQMEHIIDSVNVTLDALENSLDKLENKEYIIIDEFGLTPNEIQAIDILKNKGFTVAYLEGGMTGWKNQLNPTIGYGNPGSFTDQAKVNLITAEELKKIMSEEKLYIIDLRSEKDYSEKHIKEAINIKLADLEIRRKDFPINQRIILYDNTGFESFQGAVRLFDAGILNVYSLSEGFITWEKKGNETVK